MGKSLYFKLFLIIFLIIVVLIATVGAFLIQGVGSFYIDDFYSKMANLFANDEFAVEIRSAADQEKPEEQMGQILLAYAGIMGVDADTRNYYVLDGRTGSVLLGSNSEKNLEITPNILSAMSGEDGDAVNSSAPYMDVAVKVGEGENSRIIYIRDNKREIQSLNKELYEIIIEALLIGVAVAVLVSLLFAKALLQPISGMTKAAQSVAEGDFSKKIEVQSQDEIGVLAETFNTMADQIEDMILELNKSEQLRREFVANVSHELRTPVTSIRGYAETLTAGGEIPPEMQEKFLGVIMNESDRMTKIVQDLLELSRFDAGRENFEKQSFSMKEAAKTVCDTVMLQAEDKDQTLSVIMPQEMLKVVGDRARIEQVLLNVVTNAVKYTPEGGSITVGGGVTEGRAWIKVSDTGIGIPEKDLERVFERFYRVDKARSRESGGTGLGLSIAKEIMLRHGGDINIKSEQGRGTEVTVWMPAEESDHE